MAVQTVNKNSSPTLGVLNPIVKKPSATPKEKKVKDVAKAALKKSEKKKETCKEFVARIWSSFCNVIKKIFSCLCNFFCFCCAGDDSIDDENYKDSSDISYDLSLSEPLDEVEDFFQEIYKGEIPSEVNLRLAEMGLKKSKDPHNLATAIKHLNLRSIQFQAHAQEIATLLSSKEVPPIFEVKGQKNLGNTCYMNSVLQELENSYGVDEDECFKLISQDLSMQKGESIEEFEARLLHGWAPIPFIDETEKTNLSLQLLAKKTEYGELKEKSPEMLEDCKKEILSLQKSLRNREDRILFKWSYLLLLQAKLKGNSEIIYKALHFHHHLCFKLALHGEFKEGPYLQKDAASYREYWNDMLGVANCPVAMQRVSRFEEKNVYTTIKVDSETPIQIPITEAGNLTELIKKRFLEKKTSDDGEKCTFELKDKREIPITSFNVISAISCAPPKFLTFHFKRFVTEFKNNRFVKKKISDPLPIDPTIHGELDFTPFFRKSSLKEVKPLYELRSFVVHRGHDLDGGHYVSYVKRYKKWYCCNDSVRTEVSINSLPLTDAYMMTFSLKRN